MNEVVANLIEHGELIVLIGYFLYPKIKKVSLKGSITLTFGEEKETKDDKDNQDI